MNLHASFLPQYQKMLRNLDRWIEKAEAHAATKKYDVNNLVSARLAPDMYAFARQVQAACDSAKSTAAHLAGRPVPSHPDTEKTMPELRARIATVLAYLDTFTPADFDGASERHVVLGFLPGKYVLGADYLVEMANPNFYFHCTTAYALLRSAGVEIGKMDFIGGMKLHDQ